ncbi:hypothetical protein [Kamptonema formosum]|uniref:hypothetical protein n=1 Tax=Kamptonema formosum TaxID=331992 RepID=UPI001E58D11D|nr:hypothetical protein [Oscillatoria sp. PCC 10802]
MRTQAVIVLSSFLFVGLAVAFSGMRSDSTELLPPTTFPDFAQDKPDCDDHRGSGRVEECQTPNDSSSLVASSAR